MSFVFLLIRSIRLEGFLCRAKAYTVAKTLVVISPAKLFWTTLKVTLLRLRIENARAVTTTRAGLKTGITNGRAKNQARTF